MGPILALHWTGLQPIGHRPPPKIPIPDAAVHLQTYTSSVSASIIAAETSNSHSLQKKKQPQNKPKNLQALLFNLFPSLPPLQPAMTIGLSGPFCYMKMTQWLRGKRGEC